MTALILRGDARALPLPDASVDLVVTSPPYWKLRKYSDGGQEYENQIGSEPTPAAYLDNLWAVAAECARVLKPSGSMFFNIGDKFADAQSGSGDVRDKSLIGLPWRFAIGCTDRLGLILRRDVVWHKLNPLPESVDDRCPTAHEYLFHLTKEPRYFSATDEIREPSEQRPGMTREQRRARGDAVRQGEQRGTFGHDGMAYNPLGKLPGSVWGIPSEPLVGVPAVSPLDGRPLPDHHAAFPTEIPRRCILGWTPAGICVECGEGRRPVADRKRIDIRPGYAKTHNGQRDGIPQSGGTKWKTAGRTDVAIVGYSCACPSPSAPTMPARILDPFGGTGTTPLVADVLGRDGIGVEASHDYCRLARWRVQDPVQRAKAMRVPKPPPQLSGQLGLFEGA